MKNLVFTFALLCSSSLVAQFSYNANGSGIQSPTNNASGEYSTAMGIETTASGEYSTAMGDSTIASGVYSTAMGIETTASGSSSTAMGGFTIASGNFSTAIGNGTNASGSRSTAMGAGTSASGFISTAMGEFTFASGRTSTAMGFLTNAQDFASMAIGHYNKTDETPNPDSFSYQNTAFVIGNGGYDSEGNYVGTDESRSNAFEVLFDGSTTIAGNVTAPAFIGDGSQLTNMPLSFNATGGNGIESATNTASGEYSTAMGFESTASGEYSTAMGNGTIAGAPNSSAMGYATTASGYDSTAMGRFTEASGHYSAAMGFWTLASAQASTAIGYYTIASGGGATAMGYETTANGSLSTSMGYETVASDRSSLVIGQYNLLGSTFTSTFSGSVFSLENTAFVIGNGTDSNNKSDALVVKFNGDTTIAGDLNINSDARLKANIITLGATLSKLLQIDGKTYTMKKDANHKKKIGLLAQDIEKVFPELVTETNDIKSVNYQGLVPVLINAMKEQQEEIDSYKTELSNQRKEIDTYKKELYELKTMVKQLISK